MRVKDSYLGNGLHRLDVEPMFPNETDNIPQDVIDNMMMDIIVNGAQSAAKNNCADSYAKNECAWYQNRTDEVKFSNKPDGIVVQVDRPKQEYFDTYREWSAAMDKYRTLERLADECDWENMKDIIPYDIDVQDNDIDFHDNDTEDVDDFIGNHDVVHVFPIMNAFGRRIWVF